MIHLYTWKTPNGRKPVIALEELGLAYELHAVDIGNDEQFAPDFLKISPNNKIPAIVDDEAGVSLFESGAILEYLADKTGRLLPRSGAERYTALEWLYWQVGGVGPMFGQLGFFVRSNDKVPVAIARYSAETLRLLGVLDRRLAASAYLGGAAFGIADIAAYPWLVSAVSQFGDVLPGMLEGRGHVSRWMDELASRPSVRKGMAVFT
ncbi:MAG TPA: glutathione S-transferase N-terminal domain-containing protein [Luteibacter sp.]|jgi:GST-like protein|nr:glutathione S-transferase N-terminal domain-containing protein [Luteibacter sp.]